MSIIDDPYWYDNGPGSESWKRKMAAEKAERMARIAAAYKRKECEQLERFTRVYKAAEKLEYRLEHTRGHWYPRHVRQLVEETIEAIKELKKSQC